jgi:hypothetical protein
MNAGDAEYDSNRALIEQDLALQQRLADLRVRQEEATTITAPLFASSIAKIEAQRLGSEDSLLSAAGHIAKIVIDSEVQLDELRSLVDEGVLDIADYEAARVEVAGMLDADPVLSTAYKLVKGSGGTALAGSVEKIEVSKDAPVEMPVEAEVPQADAQSTELEAELTELEEPVPIEPEAVVAQDLTIKILNGRILAIGDSGKFLKASSRISERQRDYSKERIQLLKTIVNNPGVDLTPNEIWDMAFDSWGEFDKLVFGQFNTWSKNLTFNNVPIIVHNGKRGLGSMYRLNDAFNLSIEEVFEAPPAIKVQPVVTETPDNIALDEAITRFLGPDATPYTTLKISRRRQLEENQRPIAPFPLNQFETAAVAGFIDSMSDLMEKMGLEPININADSNLVTTLNDRDRLKTMYHYDNDLGKLREQCISMLHNFFDNRDLVASTIDLMDQNDYRYPVFEYLYLMESENLWVLLETMANEPIDQVVTINRKLWQAVKAERVLPYKVEKLLETAGNGHSPSDSVQKEVSNTEVTEKVQAVPLTNNLEVVISHEQENDPAADTEVGSKLEHGFSAKEFRKAVGEAIEALASENLLQSPDSLPLRTVSRMTNSRKMGTDEAYNRMVAAGLAPKVSKNGMRHVALTPAQIVTMYLMNVNLDVLGPSAPQKVRRMATGVIEASVDAYLKKI